MNARDGAYNSVLACTLVVALVALPTTLPPAHAQPDTPTPLWTATGEYAGDHFGQSVAGAGDVNGDGFADVIVGAWYGSAGKAYVYHGGITGLDLTPAWIATGGEPGDRYGTGVASAGDVNGDGYADVIVGAPFDGDTGYYAGKVYVYHGSSTGLDPTPAWTATGENASDLFGWSVASAGDVNGDGYADVIVGACQNDDGGAAAGKAYVYLGSSLGLGLTPVWTATGESAADRFGQSVAGAGDVNGDGFADIVVGAFWNSANGTDAGKAYVYHGNWFGLSPLPAWTAVGQDPYDCFGRSVAGAGDVNGDGYADVIVGADAYNARTGRAYVYNGSSAGLSPVAAWLAIGEGTENSFGHVATGVGDVNGDGCDDVIVGARGNDENGSSAGKVYIYHGRRTGLRPFSLWTLTGEDDGDLFGWSLAGAGDVNGDGYADVIIGAYDNDESGSDAGKAYVYHASHLLYPLPDGPSTDIR